MNTTGSQQAGSFSRRVVEVIAGDGGTPPTWTVGSGLFVAPRLVLTSAHVLTGLNVLVRGILPDGSKTTWQADVVEAGDIAVADVALLRVEDERADDLPALRIVRVDRESPTPQLIAGCSAVGYPRFKEIPGVGALRPVPIRETAHVTGELPTLDQLVSGLLTLRVSSTPRPLPALDEPLHRSEWAGMSGAVVTAEDAVIGVVTEHQPRAGQSELTVTPISAVRRLGPARAGIWSAALGVDVTDLPALPGKPMAAVEQHFHIARDLVMSQTVVPAFRARPVAPSPPPHFAGRQAELDQLAGTLRQGRTVAITGIQGMAGIGKTALALQLAADMVEFGVVLWASLGPQPNVVSHLVTWARHADPDFQAGDTPVDVLAHRVRAVLAELVRDHYPGPVLVILDDVWEGAAVAAARVLREASPPGSVYLVTTRSQLVVAQLRGARLELRPIEPAHALTMLRNLLSAHPEIADDDLTDLAAVVGHHPLAIELAAGQVQLLERPAEQIGQLVAEYRAGIPAGSPFGRIRLELGESREDNLELALSFSYAGLDPADQADFRALGALAYGAPFDRTLCEAVWQRDPQSVLDRLRHRAMIVIAPERGWYQQHSLLRAYARALLRALPEQQAGVEDAYTGFATGVSAEFADRPLDRWTDLEPYVPHVEEAGDLLVEHCRETLTRAPADHPLLTRMVDFALNTRPLLSARRELDHLDWPATGLEICRRRMDLGRVVDLLTEVAQHQAFRGDVPAAARSLDEARAVAQEVGDARAAARASLDVGQFFLLTDPDTAVRPLREALAGYESLGDERGTATALLRLAEWQAAWPHTPEVRTRAAEPLQRARALSERNGFADLRGEAVLALGRLQDTFGGPEDAIPLLAEAVAIFAELRTQAREAVARTFLAGALANAGRFDEVEAELTQAIPLFSAVGDAPGQATALRNLGELHAWFGRPARALASFGAALPLVHKMTMRYLDEDDDEPAVVPGFFTAHLEPVTALERAEQFRRRIRLTDDGPDSAHDEDSAAPGTVADDLLGYLLATTAAAAVGPGDHRNEWAAALAAFAEQIERCGNAFLHEHEFVTALRQVTTGKTVPDLLPDSPYGAYLRALVARVDGRRIGGSVLTDEDAQEYAGNTYAVRARQPEHLREWSATLRRQLRGARLWGDTSDQQFYAALLAVLAGHPAALPADHPYQQLLSSLLAALDEVERRPADLVIEKTVAVRTIAPQERDGWLSTLSAQLRDARRRREQAEVELLSALVAVTQGVVPELPKNNPFRGDVDRAVAAIDLGEPLATYAPIQDLKALAAAVIMARTTRPKSVDRVRWQLADDITTAQNIGRWAECALYRTLLAVASGEDLPAPDGLYGPVVRLVIDSLRDQPVEPDWDDTLPPEQVDTLVAAAVSAVIRSDPALRNDLRSYREELVARGPHWQREAEFMAALCTVAGGKPAQLPDGHPYRDPVAGAAEQVRRHQDVASRGGHLTGPELAQLLGGTRDRLRAPHELLDPGQSESMNGGVEAFTEFLTQAHDLAMEQARWKEIVHDLRVQLATEHPEWRHELALLGALIDLIDGRPARVGPDSPYRQDFEELVQDLPPTYDTPDPLAVLSRTSEEHQQYFRDRVSGRSQIVDQIPTALVNTVLMRTILPSEADDWGTRLNRNAERIAEHAAELESFDAGSFDAEIALLHALREVTDGGRPMLADDHPYAAELQVVLAAIDLFDGRLSWPGNLGGDQLRYLFARVCAAVGFGESVPEVLAELTELRHAHLEQYPEDTETRSFLDVLIAALDNRPMGLPLSNRYWAFLGIIRTQIAKLGESNSRDRENSTSG